MSFTIESNILKALRPSKRERFLKSRQGKFKKLVNSPFLGFEVDEVLMYRVMPSHLKKNTYFIFFFSKFSLN